MKKLHYGHCLVGVAIESGSVVARVATALDWLTGLGVGVVCIPCGLPSDDPALAAAKVAKDQGKDVLVMGYDGLPDAPDYDPPSTQNWKVDAPAARSTDALFIQFPEPLDYALLSRVIQVTTPSGDPVEGSIEVDREETRWQFRPREPWIKGDYLIEVATLLEDLAGNSLDRPFEVDVFEKVEEKVAQTTRTIRFTASAGEGQ